MPATQPSKIRKLTLLTMLLLTVIFLTVRVPSLDELIETLLSIASRQHRKLHVHAFMIFTANHCADHFVLARLVGGRELEFLLAGLEEQVPPVDPGPVLGSQQGEAMNRTVAIPRFAFVRRHAQEQLLARLDHDLRSPQPGDL